MSDDTGTLCPEDRLAAVVELLRDENEQGLATIADLFRNWPLDPRLHFLKGSVLAGMQRYEEGRSAMARAIEIAPDFALARFQLGFLDLTSGRAVDALGVWQKLGDLPEDAPLRVLAEGLANLAVDNFAEATRLLQQGMALNSENPLINADMQLILDEIKPLIDQQDAKDGSGDGANAAAAESDTDDQTESPTSAVDLLLRQQGLKDSPSKLKH